jgi:hypothetical protein
MDRPLFARAKAVLDATFITADDGYDPDARPTPAGVPDEG